MNLPKYAPPPPSAFKDTSVRGGHAAKGPKPEERKTPEPPCLICTCGTVFNLDKEHDNPVYRGLLMEIHRTRDLKPHDINYFT